MSAHGKGRGTAMKAFLILQGAPASGKSTFIHENDLDEYTVSSDEIRIEINGIGVDEDGNEFIPQTNHKRVWATVKARLASMIDAGSPVVVLDATNAVYANYKEYGQYAIEHGYTPYIVDFTGVGPEECKRRNRMRTFREVPEFVIDRFYERFNGYTPDGYTRVDERKASDIAYRILDGEDE